MLVRQKGALEENYQGLAAYFGVRLKTLMAEIGAQVALKS